MQSLVPKVGQGMQSERSKNMFMKISQKKLIKVSILFSFILKL